MSTLGHSPDRHAGFGARPLPGLPLHLAAIAVFLIALAGTSGWVLRSIGSESSPPPPAPSQAAEVGGLSVSVPGTWAPANVTDLRIPGLSGEAVAFAPVHGLRARALVTIGRFRDPSLVPEPLSALSAGARPRRAMLAGMRAWAYPARALADGRTAQVTVVPTTAGSLTVVCIAPAAVWSGAAGCARQVTGVQLNGTHPLVPSATLPFRRRMTGVIDRLGVRRAQLRGALRGARAPRGQARFATRLARVHVRAMAALAPQAGAAGAPRRVVRELRRTARGYRRLSLAARRGWPGRYRQARVAIRRSDRALARAIARVR